MNKVRNKFVLYAMLSVFALLTVLLSIINGINFTMASNDADMITQMICDKHGVFPNHGYDDKKKKNNDETADQPAPNGNSQPSESNPDGRRMGPMGPSSPEMNSSLRYFTCAFNKKGESELVAFHVRGSMSGLPIL